MKQPFHIAISNLPPPAQISKRREKFTRQLLSALLESFAAEEKITPEQYTHYCELLHRSSRRTFDETRETGGENCFR